MQSKLSKFWPILSTTLRREISTRCKSDVVIPRVNQENHIYKKTYTRKELVEHLKKNVLYQCNNYIATSVPQGIGFFKNNSWDDYGKPLVCDDGLQDIIPELCIAFNSEQIFVAKYPRRSSSGLTMLAKNFKAFQSLRKAVTDAAANLEKIHTYLVVVLGTPAEEFNKLFKMVTCYEDNLFKNVEIFDNLENVKGKRIKYQHSVLDSTEHVSLLKINVSTDQKDSVRHILAQKFFTPVLGDFWNLRKTRNFIFGAPLASDSNSPNEIYYNFHSGIREKLQLSAGEEKITPIHSHLHSLRLQIGTRTYLFATVPPPKSFVWTCKQLGLNKINEFSKTEIIVG